MGVTRYLVMDYWISSLEVPRSIDQTSGRQREYGESLIIEQEIKGVKGQSVSPFFSKYFIRLNILPQPLYDVFCHC